VFFEAIRHKSVERLARFFKRLPLVIDEGAQRFNT